MERSKRDFKAMNIQRKAFKEANREQISQLRPLIDILRGKGCDNYYEVITPEANALIEKARKELEYSSWYQDLAILLTLTRHICWK